MAKAPLRNQSTDGGASAVEYGLIVFAVAAVAALIIFALGQMNQQSFQSSCDQITSKIDGSDCT